ncbi:hypothetical protein J3F84DRAFT_376497 [Trichoderma pleuroticola]
MPWMGWFCVVLFYISMDESRLVLSGAHRSKLSLLHLICLIQRGGDYGVALELIGLGACVASSIESRGRPSTCMYW